MAAGGKARRNANGQGGVVERAEHPAWGDAFVAEWRAFHNYLVSGGPSPAGTDAARACTLAALAAKKSWLEGRPVKTSEIG